MILSNSILPENQRKEAVSLAFLAALAARDGYILQPGPSPDLDSVDATIRSGSSRRQVLDVQLKATATPRKREDGLRFRLKRKNYNDLSMLRAIPLFLIVIELPDEASRWIDCTVEKLIMRKCGWWLSLAGSDPVDEKSQTVVIPLSQRIGVAGLEPLFKHAREAS